MLQVSIRCHIPSDGEITNQIDVRPYEADWTPVLLEIKVALVDSTAHCRVVVQPLCVDHQTPPKESHQPTSTRRSALRYALYGVIPSQANLLGINSKRTAFHWTTVVTNSLYLVPA